MEPGAEPGSRSALAKVQLPAHAGLHGGLFGKTMLASGKQEVLLVPETAISRQGQLAFVYVFVEGTARRRMVTLGQTASAGVEILSGLQAGEQVITNDVNLLKDSSPAEIAR